MKDVIYRRCCGLDVHKDTIAACVRWTKERGESHKENRVFGTTTQELEKLAMAHNRLHHGSQMRKHAQSLQVRK
jgi:hypothetical protein